jgi:hypothetical protein
MTTIDLVAFRLQRFFLSFQKKKKEKFVYFILNDYCLSLLRDSIVTLLGEKKNEWNIITNFNHIFSFIYIFF